MSEFSSLPGLPSLLSLMAIAHEHSPTRTAHLVGTWIQALEAAGSEPVVVARVRQKLADLTH
jgi:hypothetical protein